MRMKKSLDDIRRQYGEKSDDSTRDSTASNSRPSDQDIKGNGPQANLNVAPEIEVPSGPEFVKTNKQLLSTADLSKIDFSSSVIAGDFAKVYSNETVFNVFSETLCNSSLRSSDALPFKLTVDENIIQQPNLDHSEIDFSSTSAANNFGTLYTNESLDKLFPASLNCSDDQCAPITASNDFKKPTPPRFNDESTSGYLNPPTEGKDIPIMCSGEFGNELYSGTTNPTDIDLGASPPPSSESTSTISQGPLNCSANDQKHLTTSCHNLLQHTTLSSPMDHYPPVEPGEPLPVNSSNNDSSSSDCNKTSDNHKVAQLHPCSLSDEDIPSQSGVGNSSSQINTDSQQISYENIHKLMDHQLHLCVKPNIAPRIESSIMKKRSDDTKNDENGNQLVVGSSLLEVQMAATGIGESSQISNGSPYDNSFFIQKSHISESMKKRTNDTKNAGIRPDVEVHNLVPREVDVHEKPTEITSSGFLNSILTGRKREFEVTQDPIVPRPIDNPLQAGGKALPVDGLPAESTSICNSVHEPELGGLPKPKDCLWHDWYFQENNNFMRLFLGTSGCGYEGEVHNNRMRGIGRFYFSDDEYIEGLWILNSLIDLKSAVLTIKSKNYDYSQQHTFTIFKTIPFFLVSLHDHRGYHFVSKAIPVTYKELDFKKPVADLKAKFLESFRIVEIIHDEWSFERAKYLATFKEVSHFFFKRVTGRGRPLLLYFLSRSFFKTDWIRGVFQCMNRDGFPQPLRVAVCNVLYLGFQLQSKMWDILMFRHFYEMMSQHKKLQEIMRKEFSVRVTEHRSLLLTECPHDFPQLTGVIKTLPDHKIMLITKEDIGVFCHLLSLPCAWNDETYEHTQNLFSHFLDELVRKLENLGIPPGVLNSKDEFCPLDSIPLVPPVFGYLFKSFSEIASKIVSIADRLCFQDMFLITSDGTWTFKKEIPWAVEQKANPELMVYCQLLKIQYYAITEILRFFSPGYYEKKNKITDKLYILSEPVELEKFSNERLAWILMLAKCIPSPNFQALEAVKLYKPLIQCYISFLEKSATDDHEMFRVVAHSIIRFLFTTITFTRQYNNSSVNHDTLLLEDLMLSVIPRISPELERSNKFIDLIEELNRYWKLHRAIDLKTRDQPAAWRLMEFLVPFVVKPILCLEVPVINLVRYLKSLNDFMNDLKDINFESCWYVKSDSFDDTLMEKVDNKLSSCENCSYRVTNIDGFINPKKGKIVPKHYILDIVREMIIYVMFHHSNKWNKKETLSNLTLREKEAKAIEVAESTGMLLDVLRHSFVYFKEQPDYCDFEKFKEAILEPYNGLVFESRNLDDFKTRIDVLTKEVFWSTRSVNEIGIHQAIASFANVNDCAISEKLSDAYNLYLMQYNNHIETYSHQLQHGLSHVQSLEVVKGSMPIHENIHFSKWTEEFKTKEIPKLLAGPSAVWSILMSRGVPNSKRFLKPHCIQILCILRLLSVDKPKGAENHLAQVSTGQGKSLILGLLSSVLALTGHKTRVVCCNSYLSSKDKNNFKEFFQHFGIASAISYGTFEDLANSFLKPLWDENNPISFRRLVGDLVLHHTDLVSLSSVKSESSDTVLLIDEVDVFFKDNYYGNSLDTLTVVRIPGLGHIQYQMWKFANNDKSLDANQLYMLTDAHIRDHIEAGNSYYREWDAFCREPGKFHLLVDGENGEYRIKEYTNESLAREHLMMMSKDAVLFAQSYKRDHLFRMNKQGLVCMTNSEGQFLPNKLQSYKNTFAYLKLLVDGVDGVKPDQFFPNAGYLVLKSGRISYARLPSQFPLIIGVGGTLNDLSVYEKKLIDSYVKELSIVPSLFGESRLKFNAESDFMFIYKQHDWLTHIYNKVNKIVQAARAVLVFFDSDEQLNLFANEYKTKFGHLNEISFNTDEEMRDWLINQAGISGTVTLSNRFLGRGVDYKSSVAVEKLGGIHVIQTFFSIDVKEEIQIKGRTARNGNEGSYELIICKKHLVHKRIIPNDESEHTYSTLQQIRRKLIENIGKRLAEQIDMSERDHETTMMYFGVSQLDKTLSDDSIALENRKSVLPGAE